jgi:hypothetical protein
VRPCKNHAAIVLSQVFSRAVIDLTVSQFRSESPWRGALSTFQEKRSIFTFRDKESSTIMAPLGLLKVPFARSGCHCQEALHADTVPRAVRVFPMGETGGRNVMYRT